MPFSTSPEEFLDDETQPAKPSSLKFTVSPDEFLRDSSAPAPAKPASSFSLSPEDFLKSEPPKSTSVPGMEKLGGIPPGPPAPPRLQGTLEVGIIPGVPKTPIPIFENYPNEGRQMPGAEQVRQRQAQMPGGVQGAESRLSAAEEKFGSARNGLPGASSIAETAMTALPVGAEAAGVKAATTAAGRQAFAALDAALSAYFVAQSAKGAGESIIEAKKAYDDGDYLGVVRQLGAAGIDAAFGWWAGQQAKGRYQEFADIAKMKRILQDRVNTQAAAEKMAETGVPKITGTAGPPATTGTAGPPEPPPTEPEAPKPTIKTAPAPVTVEAGHTYEVPTGNVEVTGVDRGTVTFNKTLPDGNVLKNNRLPMERFLRMVAPVPSPAAPPPAAAAPEVPPQAPAPPAGEPVVAPLPGAPVEPPVQGPEPVLPVSSEQSSTPASIPPPEVVQPPVPGGVPSAAPTIPAGPVPAPQPPVGAPGVAPGAPGIVAPEATPEPAPALPATAPGGGPATVSGVDPYELTRSAFMQRNADERNASGRMVGAAPFEASRFARRPDGSVEQVGEHRLAVEQALAEGKPVPPDVLADYPDLAATTQKPPSIEGARGAVPPAEPGKGEIQPKAEAAAPAGKGAQAEVAAPQSSPAVVGEEPIAPKAAEESPEDTALLDSYIRQMRDNQIRDAQRLASVQSRTPEDAKAEVERWRNDPMTGFRVNAAKTLANIRAKDPGSLTDTMGLRNPASLRMFSKVAGIDVPKTEGAITEAIRKWVGPEKYDAWKADKEKAREEKEQKRQEEIAARDRKQALETQVRYEGKVTTFGQMFDKMIAEGRTLEMAKRGSFPIGRLQTADGRFIEVKKKVYLDYIREKIAERDAIPQAEEKPVATTPVEKAATPVEAPQKSQGEETRVDARKGEESAPAPAPSETPAPKAEKTPAAAPEKPAEPARSETSALAVKHVAETVDMLIEAADRASRSTTSGSVMAEIEAERLGQRIKIAKDLAGGEYVKTADKKQLAVLNRTIELAEKVLGGLKTAATSKPAENPANPKETQAGTVAAKPEVKSSDAHREKAAEIWKDLNGNQRTAVLNGWLPDETMRAAHAEGYDHQKLAGALLNLSAESPGKPGRLEPGARVQINRHTGMAGKDEDFGVIDNISTDGKKALVKVDGGGEETIPLKDLSVSSRAQQKITGIQYHNLARAIWGDLSDADKANGSVPAGILDDAEADGYERGRLVKAINLVGATQEKPAPQTPEEAKQSGVNALVDAVQQTLESGGTLGNVNELTKLTEQHLGTSRTSGQWSPKDMFDAMEAGINKHLIGVGADLMSMPFEDAMKELRDLMGRITSQGVRTEEQVKLQQFSTPPTESFTAARVAGIRPSDVVLEPSAGNGGLAVWPKSIGAEVHVNEISERRQQMLKAAGFDNISAHDGEIINSLLDRSVKPTVVLMNPPFSAGGAKSGPAVNNNQYGFNHVNAALQRLAPGGRLVAILGGGRADDANGGATLLGGPSGKWFTDLAQRYNVRANVRVNGKEYQKYGTNFATRIIVIDKTGPTPSRVTNAPNWDSVVRGNADTLDEAYNLLKGVADDRPQIAIGATSAAGAGVAQPRIPEGRPGDVTGRGDGGVLPSGGRTPEAGAVGGESGSGRRPDGGAVTRPGGSGEPTGVRQPATGPAASGETPAARTPTGGPTNADFQRPVPGADELAASAGMTAQQIIDAAKQALGQKMGKSPAPPPARIQPATPTAAKAPRKKAAAPKPPNGNALSGASDQAMKDLEAWMKSQGGDKPSPLQARAADASPAVNQPVPPQVLINLATIGAEQMLDGATNFPAWSEAMTAKAGPILDYVAQRGNSDPQTVLRQVYQLASEVAKDFGADADPLPPAVGQAEQKDLASQPLTLERDQTPRAEHEDSAAYVTYHPTLKGPEHPGDIVETKTMATVPLPEITYRPRLPESVIKDGKLSAVQLEAIAIAGQQNSIILPGGFRASALIGDGCVAAGTRIYNPITGEHVAIEVLAATGKSHTVLSLTSHGFEPRMAECPFLKGTADLYCVMLVDLREITVTDEHRFLTPHGWKTISAGLAAGSIVATAEGDNSPYGWGNGPMWREVVSVKLVGHADFYDMYVPGPENYVAEGFVNHNTGVGKGRIAAGILWDNYRQGRKRLVFVTEKWDLMQDIIRDLHGIGANELLRNVDRNKAGQWVTGSQSSVRPFNKWQAGTKIQHDGILFSTYALIRSENNKGETRVAQLEGYLRGGDDGEGAVIVFDECLPAGTMIETPNGAQPIESLRHGDEVLGFNHETGQIEATKVQHCFQRQTADPLLSVNGVPMTGNHPVWTEDREYVRADALNSLDRVALIGSRLHHADRLGLRVVPAAVHGSAPLEHREEATPVLRDIVLSEVADVAAGRSREVPDGETEKSGIPSSEGTPQATGVSRQTGAVSGVGPESDSEARDQGSGGGCASREGVRAPERGQWPSADEAAEDAGRAAWVAGNGMGARVSGPDGQAQSSVPDLLQGRHREQVSEDRDRGGRRGASLEPGAGAGREKDASVGSQGLDGSALPQQTGAGLAGSGCAGGSGPRIVYNIETGTGNYFAGGLLVHNCHALKNAVVGMGGQASQIGVAVKNLLQSIPKLRTTSLSATAATDVMNLGYLDRLGLWGPGTAFPTGFNEFAGQIAGGRLAAMEMVARELKAQGKYLSRTLSFKGVTYEEAEHQINPEQADLYRTATQAWRSVVSIAEQSIAETTNGGSRQKARFLSQFGATQQRFFNLLITALKTPTAVDLAQKALASGKSVVITLVNTNEAAQNREKARASIEGDEDDVPDFDFGPKQLLIDLVRDHYPVQQYADDVDDNGNPIKVPVTRPDPNNPDKMIAVNNPEAEAARDALIAQIDRDLHMPENPLDILINSLGGPSKVAELTGRKERFDSSVGKFVPRGDPTAARKDVNLFEMRAFQEGKKRVSILSTAAGTGISLHAGNDVPNQQKRYHITLQVGWSADKAMQMFGRTHRTNQVHPPEYVMLVSDLGGEKRFVSTIARRLGSLGAITKGQKDATSGTDLMDKVNFETEQGRQAAQAFYEALLRDQPVPGAIKMDQGEDGAWTANPEPMTGKEILSDLRMLSGDPPTVPLAQRQNVTKLLNRLLALDPEAQNGTYNYYYDIFQAAVQRAIENNTLDTGVKTLPGDTFQLKEEKPIGKDPSTGAETYYYKVDANVKNKRMSVADLEKRMAANASKNPQILRRDTDGKLALAVDANPIVHANGALEEAYYVSTPAKGVPVKTGVNSIRNRVQPVEDWAKKELGEAKRALGYIDLSWRESRYADAKRLYPTTIQERISSLEDRVRSSFGSTREGLERSLSLAKSQLAAFNEAGELPADNYERVGLEKARAEAENLKQRVAVAEEAAVDPVEWAKREWQEQYDDAPSHTSFTHHLIGGAVMRYWNAVREASQLSNIYTATDTKTGRRVVGVDVPGERIGALLARITGGSSTVNASQLRTDVLRNNLTYQLEGGIQVRRGMIARQPVIQLIPANNEQAQNLKSMGVLYERGVMPMHYVPNNETGPQETRTGNILTRVLDQYPVQQDTPDGGPGGGGPAPLQSRGGPEGLQSRRPVPGRKESAATATAPGQPPLLPEAPPPAGKTWTLKELRNYWDAAVAKPEVIEGQPALWVNGAAMDIILTRIGVTGQGQNSSITMGLALSPGEWLNVLEEAHVAARDPRPGGFDEALARIGKQIEDVLGLNTPGASRTQPLVVVQAGDSIKRDAIPRILNEEIDHAKQMRLPRGVRGLPVEMLDSAPGRKAVAALVRQGYNDPDPRSPFYSQNRAVMAAEVGARLMRGGRYQEMDLTPEEGVDLAAQYIEGLERHGDKATQIIEDTANAIKENRATFGRGSQDLIGQHEARGGGAPQGGTQGSDQLPAEPEPAGPQPVASRANQFLKDESGESRIGQLARDLAANRKALLSLGLGKFIKEDLVPAAADVAHAIAQGRGDLQRVLAPAARGEDAKRAALTIRERAAELAQATDRAEASLSVARRYFEAQPFDENLNFIDRMEKGEKQDTPTLNGIAEVLRETLDDRRDQVQALGTGKLENYYENYFPHIWKKPTDAERVFKEWFSRRPMEGSKSFLKQRTLPTVMDGVNAGLEPESYNPIDLVLMKLREMDKYIFAHRALNDLKAAGVLKYVRATERAPEGFAKIEDNIATVYEGKTEQGSIAIRGQYYAPEPAAAIVNNYLSPGLRKYAGFRAYLSMANVLNQFQLGWSAYHLGFTSFDAAVSRVALGIMQIANGQPIKGLATAASFPAAPFRGVIQGSKVLEEWYRPGSQGADLATIVDAMVVAGGRARMDRFYTTQITKKMVEALRRGNVLGAAFRAPFALTEQAARPIMEWIVPRQKIAVFADLAREILAQAGPGANPRDVREELAKAWDSVDNRMGQLVYDNLFWNKASKDLMMASVRSVGWNVGTIREIVGGGRDTVAAVVDAARGNKPKFTTRMAYLIALPIVAGLIGGILHYMNTGEKPAELKDYFFPRRGARGTPGWSKRMTLPSYVKDVVHWTHDPWGTAKGKIHPLLSLVAEMLSNKDYFDRPIRNSADPLVKQVEDSAKHALKAFEPMALRPTVDQKQRQTTAEKVLPFVGITEAPKYIKETPRPRRRAR